MPFKIVRNDITKMHVDAIVNTANEEPLYSTGTDAAMYTAAGITELLGERHKIGYMEEGEVAITSGFRLPAKYIIHAVSSYYTDGTFGEAEKLRACYEKSLALALKYRCKSIAFPLIATGSFGYPKAEGLEIALDVIHGFLLKHEMMVYLVVFDSESVRLSGRLFDDIESYVDEHYVQERIEAEYQLFERSESVVFDECDEMSAPLPETVNTVSKRSKQLCKPISIPEFLKASQPQRSLQDIVNNVGETFQQQLLRLIDERGRDVVDVYKGACKDKKFFYKIKSNVQYQPTKHTVFAFAISLQLSLDEVKDLLASAGYAFSGSSRFDLIMQYVFEQKIYDMYKIDCILYDFGEEKYYFSCE